MPMSLRALVLFALVPLLAICQDLQDPWINTPPKAVLCQPVLIQWTGTAPPFILSVVPGGQPDAPALLSLGQSTGSNLTWIVNISAGISVTLNILDGIGRIAQSAPFTI
ncbi:MAG: hypothetical protein J3R72DRAFT_481055 [Linnemannia gamsii]|nr:MAG: hypothetical protein J3R72DRAFT_481055 [Linnemannia gamsii]